jgi:hypothetical protein
MAETSPGPRDPQPDERSGGGYGLFLIIAASALLILAALLASRLEFYERERWVRPSGEVRSNNFYVLGKWLSQAGRPARFSPRWAGVKDIAPREGGLFIQASLFNWEREDILSWVREGGVLAVSIDLPWYYLRDDPTEEAPPEVSALEEFLEKLEIRIRPPFQEENTGIDEDPAAAEEYDIGEGPQLFPDYDHQIAFEEPPPGARPEDLLVLRDKEGGIRLIRRTLGKGRVAVAGSYVFMYNYYLREEVNARLAWELTGASLGPERPGILFVRGRRGAEGLFGILRERGNLLPPILSGLVLIVIGFWTVLPGFGLPLREEGRKRLSIAGRFSAESRFLRRYDALGVYLETYLRELRRRGMGREPGREIKELEAALAAGKKIGPRKTAVYLKNLMAALERI